MLVSGISQSTQERKVTMPSQIGNGLSTACTKEILYSMMAMWMELKGTQALKDTSRLR
jgi:hypothetical protein